MCVCVDVLVQDGNFGLIHKGLYPTGVWSPHGKAGETSMCCEVTASCDVFFQYFDWGMIEICVCVCVFTVAVKNLLLEGSPMLDPLSLSDVPGLSQESVNLVRVSVSGCYTQHHCCVCLQVVRGKSLIELLRNTHAANMPKLLLYNT